MFSFVKQNNPDAVVIKLLKNLKINIAPETIVAEGSVGTMTGNYSSAQAIANDIQATCRSGQGTCTAVGS